MLDTNSASFPFNHKGLVTSKNFSGKMGRQVPTEQAGSLTLREEELCRREKYLEKQIVNTFISLAAILLFLYVSSVKYFHQFKTSFWLDGKKYEMVGLTKLEDKNRAIYMPIFEEKK